MLTEVLIVALYVAAAYYACLVGSFAWGFYRVRRDAARRQPDSSDSLPFVSVIVPARNEEEHIEACLGSILSNDYPPERLEVIVVDDASEDGTAGRVQRLQHQLHAVAEGPMGDTPAAAPTLVLQRLSDEQTAGGANKGRALTYGVRTARGEIVLTTDADCVVGPRWIRTMAGAFSDRTGFVAGPVRYRPGSSLFGQLQSLEFIGLVATGAGGIGLGYPNMCNSANVAYRRVLFEQYLEATAGGPSTPGDDEILAQYLAMHTSWDVRFCSSRDAFVETNPVRTLRAFWEQQKRWAGTGPRYPNPVLVGIIGGVYAVYVLLLAGMVLLPFVPALWVPVGVAFSLKLASESALLYPACRYVEQSKLFLLLFPAQFLVIPFGVALGPAVAFGKTYWKGRRVFS